MISSSASRWKILAYGAVQGDVYWCNRLSFLDLGAISCHIFVFHVVADVKILHIHGAGALFFMVPLAMPDAVSFSQ